MTSSRGGGCREKHNYTTTLDIILMKVSPNNYTNRLDPLRLVNGVWKLGQSCIYHLNVLLGAQPERIWWFIRRWIPLICGVLLCILGFYSIIRFIWVGLNLQSLPKYAHSSHSYQDGHTCTLYIYKIVEEHLFAGCTRLPGCAPGDSASLLRSILLIMD